MQNVEVKIGNIPHLVQMNDEDAKQAEKVGHRVVGTEKPAPAASEDSEGQKAAKESEKAEETAPEAEEKAKSAPNKSKTAANK